MDMMLIALLQKVYYVLVMTMIFRTDSVRSTGFGSSRYYTHAACICYAAGFLRIGDRIQIRCGETKDKKKKKKNDGVFMFLVFLLTYTYC